MTGKIQNLRIRVRRLAGLVFLDYIAVKGRLGRNSTGHFDARNHGLLVNFRGQVSRMNLRLFQGIT